MAVQWPVGRTDGRTNGGEASQGVEYHCIVIELDLHIGAGPAASTHRERGGRGRAAGPAARSGSKARRAANLD